MSSETGELQTRHRARDATLSSRLPRIVKLELILTEACNLGCSYCFEDRADARSSMSEATAQAAVDHLIDNSRDSTWVGISFMGGEPLLQFDLIARVVDYATTRAAQAGKRIAFDMQTNGVLLREEHARFFRDHRVHYCLSLDGGQLSNDRHRKTLGGSGTFQIVAAKMAMLKRYQHWQGARMTVMPSDASRLAENIRALHEDLAINQFVIGFATHVSWAQQDIVHYSIALQDAFEYFVEQRVRMGSRRLRIGLFELGQLGEAHQGSGESRWGCGAGSGRLAVSPDGTFHGCSKLAWRVDNRSAMPPLPLGDVRTGLSNQANRLLLLDHSATPRSKCHTCEIRSSCNGGCYAASIVDTGQMYVPADYFCKLMFAQKSACDYARTRMRELKVRDLRWSTDVPDLTDASEWAE